jgi:hypothetical protein
VGVATLERPARAAALRRTLAMLGLPSLALWASGALQSLGLAEAGEIAEGVAAFALIPLGIFALAHASLRIAGKRAPWDRLSGTMVRYRTPRSPGALRHLLR